MHELRFNPAQADKLDDPERLKWLPPQDLIARLGIRSGCSLADIGAGTGYFSIPFAEVAGRTGRVFAVDVAAEMLDRISVKAAAGGLRNITLVQGEAASTGLADSSCDLVFMANVWHEFDDHGAVLTEARRILKPAGYMAIVDWRADLDSPPGPPRDRRISDHSARLQVLAAGYKVQSQAAFGQYSWLLTAIPGETKGS